MPLSLYIHWPFCKSKCPYCDFNSHVREGIDAASWQQAYLTELGYFAPYIQGRRIESVFFGGGTPSLMPPAIVEAVLAELSKLCQVPPNVEVTLEANPTSVETKKFQAFRTAGINRLSLGVQSLKDEDLKFLGREHNAKEALYAIDLARKYFNRYSFDLIYARPTQTLAAWEKELQQALAMAGKHLSLYQLTIEKGTPFFSAYQKSAFPMPDEILSSAFYQLTEEAMNAAGMPAYEISNYAIPGEECRHNMAYWRYGEYLGIGPGAHSRLVMDGKRHALMMTHHPENWLRQVAERRHGIQSDDVLHQREIIEECLLMGLRLTEGVERSRFTSVTGKNIEDIVPKGALENMEKAGLIRISNTHMATTYAGRMVLNAVVEKLVAV